MRAKSHFLCFLSVESFAAAIPRVTTMCSALI